MRKQFTITLFSLLLSFVSVAQFGFERQLDIVVVKDEIALKYPWAGGMDYCQFSNIDLDFDGDEDLFIFDRTCNEVLTFIQEGGIGESNYRYAPEYESEFPSDLHDWVLLVDYNCDGVKDIFTYSLGGGRVFLNTGNITDGHIFELQVELMKTYIYGGYSYMFLSSQDVPAIVDIDHDGDLDILGFGVGGTAVE